MGEDSRTSTRSASRVDPPALASDYLRSFAGALRKVHAFDDFFEALGQVVGEDTYLAGSAELSDYFKSPATEPEFEDLDDSETVVSVTGAAGNAGYLRYRGRRDGEPFGAEDLHLMGAIAGFIAVVTAQADRFRRQGESTRVFQYLINQLPLGVVCYKADGELLIENKVAARLLGDEGALLLKGILNEAELAKKGRIRLHIEAEEKLLFVEGRRLKVDDTLSVTAFVLHDMSGQREKLLLQLERAAFRAESRGSALTVALLEDRSEAGRLYRLLKESAEVIEHSSGVVQSLDAFTCACVFEENRLRSVRYLLRNTFPNRGR